MRPSQVLLGSLVLVLAGTPAAVAQPFFEDGFESGNTLAYGQSFGEPPLTPADAFRTSDLRLRDPHVFVSLPIFGCFDFTDQNLPLNLGPSFNAQLNTAITTDGDGDGFLDLSLLFLARPLTAPATNVRADSANGLCATASCDRDPASVPQTTFYSTQTSGLCLDAVPGTTSGYSPGITPPSGLCFATLARNLTLSANGVPLPLLAVQSAATLVGTPASTLNPGLLRGFLTEAAANAILLPADLPVVGGQPFSILLPGGQGNCAGHDARDTFESQSGWWFYFNSSAARISWTGP